MFANAGIMSGGSLSERKVEDHKRMVDCNICGVLHVITAVLLQFHRWKIGQSLIRSR